MELILFPNNWSNIIASILLALHYFPTSFAFVFNERNFECAPCMCPEEDNPVCVNENDKSKKFVTYKNPCEFFCTAFCYEATTKFMYCGKCDDRPLPKKPTKGDPANFTCLGFSAEGGGGGGMEGGGAGPTPKPGKPSNDSSAEAGGNDTIGTLPVGKPNQTESDDGEDGNDPGKPPGKETDAGGKPGEKDPVDPDQEGGKDPDKPDEKDPAAPSKPGGKDPAAPSKPGGKDPATQDEPGKDDANGDDAADGKKPPPDKPDEEK